MSLVSLLDAPARPVRVSHPFVIAVWLVKVPLVLLWLAGEVAARIPGPPGLIGWLPLAILLGVPNLRRAFLGRVRRRWLESEPQRRGRRIIRAMRKGFVSAGLVNMRTVTKTDGRTVNKVQLPAIRSVLFTLSGVEVEVRPLPAQRTHDFERAADVLRHSLAAVIPNCVEVVVSSPSPGSVVLHVRTTADPLAVVAESMVGSVAPEVMGGYSYDQIIVGKQDTNELVGVSLNAAPHVLVAGATGTGKSVLQSALILGALRRAFELWAVDPKRVELALFRPVATRFAADPHEGVTLLEDLHQEMTRRYELLEAHGRRNWDSVLGPRILCVVDEVSALLLAVEKKVRADLERWLGVLAMQGRAAGIHLLLTTQRPSADSFPTSVRSNIPVRLVGRLPDRSSSDIATGDRSLAALPVSQQVDTSTLPHGVPGRFVMIGEGSPVWFQAHNITDEDIANTVQQIRRHRSGGVVGGR